MTNFTQTLRGKNSPNITVLDNKYELPVLNFIELIYTIQFPRRAQSTSAITMNLNTFPIHVFWLKMINLKLSLMCTKLNTKNPSDT